MGLAEMPWHAMDEGLTDCGENEPVAWRRSSDPRRGAGRGVALVLGLVIGLYGGFFLIATALAVLTGRPASLTVQGCARTKNSHRCYATDANAGPDERLVMHRLYGDHSVRTLDVVRVHYLPGRHGWAFVDGGWEWAKPALALLGGGAMCVWAWRDLPPGRSAASA